MSEDQDSSNDEVLGSPFRGTTNNVVALVILLNAVTGGLGGLYVSTQSIVVTAIAAGLVALLGLYVLFSCRRHR